LIIIIIIIYKKKKCKQHISLLKGLVTKQITEDSTTLIAC